MLRSLIAAAVLLAGAGSAAAESYICRSLDGEPPTSLDFTIRYSSGAWAVMSVAFQVEGDVGYSTITGEPTGLAIVTGVEIASAADVAFRLQAGGQGDRGDVASIHVVTLSEGETSLTAGVLQVTGGGLWPIQCDIADEG